MVNESKKPFDKTTHKASRTTKAAPQLKSRPLFVSLKRRLPQRTVYNFTMKFPCFCFCFCHVNTSTFEKPNEEVEV